MTKKVPNTPKGRKSLPRKPGVYNLKDKKGQTNYTGHTNNLRRRISEHYADPSTHFSSVTFVQTFTKERAQKIENRRLHQRKPPKNKLK